jgi:hypothetical protein
VTQSFYIDGVPEGWKGGQAQLLVAWRQQGGGRGPQ